MAYSVGNVITCADIINKFNTSVINVIKADAYDLTNPPMDGPYQCVPSSEMDSLENLPTPQIGIVNQRISASTLVNTLVAVTQNLTRVGTFSYTRYRRESHTADPTQGTYYEGEYYAPNVVIYDRYVKVASKSGKVVLNSSYIKTLTNLPATVGIVSGGAIKIADINSLCTSCLNAWNSTTKENYTYRNNVCHTVCHENCHNNCYNDCHTNCYAD